MRHGSVHNVKSLVRAGLLLILATSQFVQAQLNDPTRPPNIAEEVISEAGEVDTSWDLSSILVSPERRVAIINGQAVKSGDMLAGAEVLNIDATGVKLKYRGEIILLKLFPGNIKTSRDTQK